MTAATKNFTIEQKATWKKRIVWRDSANNPLDLTGYSAHMQIRDIYGAIVADLSSVNGKITLGGAAGTVDLLLSVAETTLMTPSVAMLYDLKFIAPDLSEDRKLQGKIILSVGQTE